MPKVAKLDWAGEPGLEFVELRKNGKSYLDCCNFFYSKYGVSYTQARMSQLNKKFKEQGLLN